MKTNIHIWSYLAYFFLEQVMFQTKVVEKIKTPTLCSTNLFSVKNLVKIQAVIKFFFLQGKAPKEIHAILIETLACFLPG